MEDKQIHEIFKKILSNPELADEMEKTNPGIKSQLSGYLLSHWLPIDNTRRSIMVAIIVVSVLGFIYVSNYFLLLLVMLIFFSPRAVGEIVVLFGKLNKNK